MNTNFSTGILLDYLSFTVPYSVEMLEKMIDEFAGPDWTLNGFGGMGYTESIFILEGGRIFWHTDRPEMGIHVRLNSASLALVDYTPIGLINRVLDWGGKFSRADVAYDDTDGLLDIDLMRRKLENREVSTPFSKLKTINGVNMGSGEGTGQTLNIGRRTSQSFIRIYDKAAEQRVRGKAVKENDHWVRVEIELKGKKATAFCSLLSDTTKGTSELTPAELCGNLLFGLLDFKTVRLEDVNKTRWQTCDWWLDFVSATKKLRIRLPDPAKTLEGTKRWIRASVATSLAMILLSHPDDDGTSGYDFIMNTAREGEARMKKQHKIRLELYNSRNRPEKQIE